MKSFPIKQVSPVYFQTKTHFLLRLALAVFVEKLDMYSSNE